MSSYQYCKARVMETTGTVGNGPLNLVGPSPGYRGFWQAFGPQGETSALCYYAIVDSDGQCEHGFGTISNASVLTRDLVLMNNYFVGGSPLVLGTGTKQVFCPYPPQGCLQHGLSLLTVNDTTPSVMNGNSFIESNSASTTITYFDDGIDGQQITILFDTAFTTIAHGSLIKLAGGVNFTSSSADTMRLVRIGGIWYEQTRSVNP